MAPVPKVLGSKLLVQIGDGGSPTEVFATKCFINTQRGIQFQSETGESIQPDCDNPDDPAWKTTTKDGLSASVNGAGRIFTADTEFFWNWFKQAATKNCRINVNVVGASGGGYWAGAFHLTGFELGAEGLKENIEVSGISLVSDGALTWTANA